MPFVDLNVSVCNVLESAACRLVTGSSLAGQNSMNIKFLTLATIVFSLAFFRLMPHLPNVSPVAAMALFGGAYFSDKRLAMIVPMLALLLSDLFLGLHQTMIFVYAGFAITVVLGMWLQHHISVVNTALAAVIASVIFFLLTNMGVWLTSTLYPASVEGLMQACVAGIPFFQNSLLGNLVFTALIFGGYELLKHAVRPLREA